MLGSELLCGDKLELTGLEVSDADVMVTWFTNGEYLRLWDADTAYPLPVPALQERIRAWQTPDKAVMFGLRRRADGVLIGMGGYDAILWRCQAAWLSLAIERACWGQGYGGEALKLILRYGFQELNLHRVQLTVMGYNERAIKLYHRAGFQDEGIFREFVVRDGQRHDVLLMGLLQKEWRQLATPPSAAYNRSI